MNKAIEIANALRAVNLPADGVCAVHDTSTPSVLVACGGGVYRLDLAGPMSADQIAAMVKIVGEACEAPAQLLVATAGGS